MNRYKVICTLWPSSYGPGVTVVAHTQKEALAGGCKYFNDKYDLGLEIGDVQVVNVEESPTVGGMKISLLRGIRRIPRMSFALLVWDWETWEIL